MAEFNDEKALMLMKDAFKRFLKEQLGPIEDKPPIELGAWSLALIELAHEVRSHQLSLADESVEGRASPDL